MNFLIYVRAKLKLLRTHLIKGMSKMAITLPPIIELKTFSVKYPPVKFHHNQSYFSEKKIEVRGLKPTNSEIQ